MDLTAEQVKRLGRTRRSKYGAKPTTVQGIRFASKREAAAYVKLKALEKAGAISRLTLQPRYELVVRGVKVCEYRGDFRYVQDGAIVVADAKGYRTRDYKLKRKLMLACWDIEVVEL